MDRRADGEMSNEYDGLDDFDLFETTKQRVERSVRLLLGLGHYKHAYRLACMFRIE